MKYEAKNDAVDNIADISGSRVTQVDLASSNAPVKILLSQIEDMERLPRISVKHRSWNPFADTEQGKMKANKLRLSKIHILSVLVGLLAVLFGFLFYSWTSESQ